MHKIEYEQTSGTDFPHRIKLATSSCLLGNAVRYDGGHKRNTYLTEVLHRYFEFIAFCPEAAIGMGIPRAPIRLVKNNNDIRAVGVDDTSLDKTHELVEYAKQVAKQQLSDISGFIFKKDSPSCGMQRVKVFDHNSVPSKIGTGIFAAEIIKNCPNLPVEEEGRLIDPQLRENFIERVFIYYRWQQVAENLTPQALVEFHACHKFNVLAHDEPVYRKLGRIVAEAGSGQLHPLSQRYIGLMMQALKKVATKKKHVNVLMHVMGFIKGNLTHEDKSELLELLEAYRLGQIPLIVPITLLKHYLRRYPQPYIEQQYYLNPYPEELMLRNTL